MAEYVKTDILLKIKDTVSQTVLNKEDRMENPKGAFAVNDTYTEDELRNASIILFDDVITTGATIHEACKTIVKAGAKNVNVLSIAKTLKVQDHNNEYEFL